MKRVSARTLSSYWALLKIPNHFEEHDSFFRTHKDSDNFLQQSPVNMY